MYKKGVGCEWTVHPFSLSLHSTLPLCSPPCPNILQPAISRTNPSLYNGYSATDTSVEWNPSLLVLSAATQGGRTSGGSTPTRRLSYPSLGEHTQLATLCHIYVVLPRSPPFLERHNALET